jgi:hypothetical protein
MRFTWFRADRRLSPTTPPSSQVHTLRSFSLLAKWKPVTPSKIGPKTAPGEVHRSPCPSRCSLPAHSYQRRSDDRLHTGRHPQGCDPAKSPLSHRRVATTNRPDAPLGLYSTSGSHLVATTEPQDRSPGPTTLGPSPQPKLKRWPAPPPSPLTTEVTNEHGT